MTEWYLKVYEAGIGLVWAEPYCHLDERHPSLVEAGVVDCSIRDDAVLGHRQAEIRFEDVDRSPGCRSAEVCCAHSGSAHCSLPEVPFAGYMRQRRTVRAVHEARPSDFERSRRISCSDREKVIPVSGQQGTLSVLMWSPMAGQVRRLSCLGR